MIDLFGGSILAKGCRRVKEKIGAAARSGWLLSPRPEGVAMENSTLAKGLGAGRLTERFTGAMRESALLGTLYHYGKGLWSLPLRQLPLLTVPLLLLLGVRMLVAGRLALGAVLLLCMGVSLLLLLAEGTVGSWCRGSLVGRWLPAEAQPLPRFWVWLLLCGLAGGAVGWVAGVTYGVGCAAALLLFPVFFCIPPYGMLCLLLGLLPLLGTAACWALSFAVAVLYLFGRAFGGLAGRKTDGLDLLLALFPVFCVVSTLCSYDRGDSLKVLAMWLGLFLCVPLIRRLVTTKEKLVGALAALIAGATASGVYGLWQYLSGMTNDTWTDTALFDNIQLRVYSTFANPNVYGEFLLLVIPLAAGLALYLKGSKRWLVLGADALLLVNMVLSYSRGCYVGIALTAVVFFWNFSKKWLAVLTAVGVPLAILMMPESVMARILSIGNMSDTSTSYRMLIYIGTLLMFTRYWFGGLGIGEGAFNVMYPYYMLTAVTAPHTHSLIFQSVVSFGIVGLAYLGVLFVVYQRRIKAAERTGTGAERMLLLGFGAVLWGFMVQSIFDYTWYNYRVFQLFWMVILLGFAAVEVLQERSAEDGKTEI